MKNQTFCIRARYLIHAGFKPLCLTEYFARQHDCGPKAVLNTPMADSFYRQAAQWARTRTSKGAALKRDVVLYDPDELGHFDPTQIQVHSVLHDEW